VPRHAGQLPAYYNYKPSKEYWIRKGWGKRYVDMPASPLFAFGHGLSYTAFDYSNLSISPKLAAQGGEVRVSADIRNIGAREGAEVVQLYLRDVLASVSRPVMELRGFEKISLKPGETRTVAFTLTREDLTMLDQGLNPVVEPGTFRVMVGHSSADIRLTGEFEVR
jgi:beta-glucosidase